MTRLLLAALDFLSREGRTQSVKFHEPARASAMALTLAGAASEDTTKPHVAPAASAVPLSKVNATGQVLLRRDSQQIVLELPPALTLFEVALL